MVGAGGLGSPIGLYLAAAGVGHIGVVDYDLVEASNLQRQVMHGKSMLGALKAESARRRMADLNPHIQVDTYTEPFTSENALTIAEGYQIIVDGTDNFPTRYLTNDLCVLTGRPLIYGAVYRFEGQASVFDARYGPCYRCLFPEPPPPEHAPTCSDVGVFGIMPGLVGMIQAAETLKTILGIGNTLINKLMLIDSLTSSFETIQIKKNPNCKLCGPQSEITDLVDYVGFCGVPLPGEDNLLPQSFEMTPHELDERLKCGERIRLVDVRQATEGQISTLPNAVPIPYEQLSQHLSDFSPEEEIIFFCRTGHRSAWAQRMFSKAGFRKVWNLKGGINAWGREIDAKIYQY